MEFWQMRWVLAKLYRLVLCFAVLFFNTGRKSVVFFSNRVILHFILKFVASCVGGVRRLLLLFSWYLLWWLCEPLENLNIFFSVQVMALIAYLMEFKGNYGPHLIIVPNAVMVNWKVIFRLFHFSNIFFAIKCPF